MNAVTKSLRDRGLGVKLVCAPRRPFFIEHGRISHQVRTTFSCEADRGMYEHLRKHQRISLRTELWIGQDGIFTRRDETLRDISVGGAYIESRQIHPVGSIVNVRFRLPVSPNLVSCSAIVRSATVGVGFGVKFLDISRENVHVIERQVAGETARRQIRL